LVIFVDVRGFTRWSDTPEVFSNLETFISTFQKIIRSRFDKANLIKELGDGAMIVRELGEGDIDPTEILKETLGAIKATNDQFSDFCKRFEKEVGHATSLNLGWGVVRGKLRRIARDYVGSNVNKGSRLCDSARPHGIVIDYYDFKDIPESSPFHFFMQTRKLSGLQEAVVWVTPEIKDEFLPREKLRERPEVHVAGTCIEQTTKGDVRILIAKRIPQREMYGGKYEGCGGQLAENETFVEGVARHFRKEMGIEVRALCDLHRFYVIRLPNTPVIPGIRFLCEQIDDRAPTSIRHTEVKWVTETEFRRIPAEEFVGDLRSEVLELLKDYKKNKGQ
jgi:class 3 adenylate cyclase/ADP-ribose pyrophosphatase YjhB (NUDIX family)